MVRPGNVEFYNLKFDVELEFIARVLCNNIELEFFKLEFLFNNTQNDLPWCRFLSRTPPLSSDTLGGK